MTRATCCHFWTLFIVVVLVIMVPDGSTYDEEDSICSLPLGLDLQNSFNKHLADGAFSSSAGDTPSAGRLNNPNGAWCFVQSGDEDIFLTVDLGGSRLVTGFVAQGPPLSVEPKDYRHILRLNITVSVDGDSWSTVRSQPFTCDDDDDAVDVSTETTWNETIFARYVRFTILTGISFLGQHKTCLRLEVLGCAEDDVIPQSNIQMVGNSEGVLEVTWDDPLLFTKDDKPIRLPVFEYILSYGIDDRKVEKMSNQKKLVVEGAYLAATYNFTMNCITSEMKFTCQGLSARAFPTCPHNWVQLQNVCYNYKNVENTWLDAREKCQSMIQNQGSVPPSETLPTSTKVWLADQSCLDVHPPAETEAIKCCGTLNNHEETFDEDNCAVKDIQPFACVMKKDVNFAAFTNIIVSAPSKSSIHVKWDYKDHGWKPSTVLVHLLQSKDVLASENVSMSKETTLQHTIVDNSNYTIELIARLNTNDISAKKKFYSTDKGVLMEANLDAYIIWDGCLKIEWEKCEIHGNDATIQADEYILTWYRNKDEHNKQQATVTVENNLNVAKVQFPVLDDTYQFELQCRFQQETFPCGHKLLKTDLHGSQHQQHGNDMIIYTFENEAKTWHDADEYCKKQDGFLTSIDGKEENAIVTKLARRQSFWIGGQICDKKGAKAWASGKPWNYIPPKMDVYFGERCCFHIMPTQSDFVWTSENCSKKKPFVCRFQIPVIVDEVQDVKHEFLSDDRLFVQWKQPTTHWQPSFHIINRCQPKAVGQQDDTKGSCTEVTRLWTSSAAIVASLEPSTTYNIQIESVLQLLNTKKISEFQITTSPQKAIEHILNTEGILKLKWIKKINDGGAKSPCQITVTPLTNNELPPVKVDGTAEVEVYGLKIATSYKVVFKAENGDSDSIDIVTYPACQAGQVQFEMQCYHSYEKESEVTTSQSECTNNGQHLAVPTSVKHRLIMALIAKESNQHFWINKDSKTEDQHCQSVSPETQDLTKDNCDSKKFFICEKKTEVRMLKVEALAVEVDSDTSATIRWSPPQSWQPNFFYLNLAPNTTHNKDKRAVVEPLKLTETNFSAFDLVPDALYSVKVTPVTQNADVSYEGPSAEITFTQQKSTVPTSLPVVSDPDSVKEIPNNMPPFSESLMMFHVIGCSTLVGLVGISIVIFILFRGWSTKDGLAQLFMQSSLIVVHVLLLLMIESPKSIDFHSSSICIHFFSTAVFSFILVEACIYAKALTNFIPTALLATKLQVILIGWLPPLIVIAFSAGLLKNYYPRKYHCWVLVDTDLLYATVIPIAIFGGLSFLIFAACLCCRPSHNYEVDEESYHRESAFTSLRWIMCLILALQSISWSCGMLGTDWVHETLILVFIISTIVLGVTIFILRTLGDPLVRKNIKTCFVPNRVSPEESTKVAAFLPQKQPVDYDKHVLTAPPTAASRLETGQRFINRTYVYEP